MSENNLILQSKKDQLITKIENCKAANLAQVRETRLKESRKLFTGYFIELAWEFFEISVKDLKIMDREELMILAEAIARKAKPWMIFQKIISAFFILPIMCVAVGGRNGTAYYSWYYLYHYKILRAADNENYFPQDNLLKGEYKAGYGGY